MESVSWVLAPLSDWVSLFWPLFVCIAQIVEAEIDNAKSTNTKKPCNAHANA